MNFIRGSDRQQRQFLPECIEDYVRADSVVRFIDAFVDSLDLREAKFQWPKDNSQNRGRPAYHPAGMLKLYLYGYFHQVRSSRRLEAECQRNLEVIWLMNKLAPDFKTIADFRKDNAQAFKAVLRLFNQLCKELELFGGELIAIDGTKVKAQNAPGKNWSATKLEKQMQRLDKHLEEYLQALDQSDQAEQTQAHPLSAEELKEKKQQVERKLGQMKAQGQTQLSATDPESRSMKGAHGYVVGYNVQGAADSKHHLLVSTEVVNACADQGQLAPMAQAAKEELGVAKAEVVADGGYFTREDVKQCEQMGMAAHLPESKQSPSERAGFYGKKDFVYQQQSDSYVCPAGQQLSKRRAMQREEARVMDYDNPKACAQCSLKARCTKAKYRTVSRWEHEEYLERMMARVTAQPEKLARRKGLIEHCWGTLKWLLAGGFLLKGLKKVRAELNLAHFAYNLKRALKVIGLEKLLEALKKARGKVGTDPEPSTGAKTGGHGLPQNVYGTRYLAGAGRLLGARLNTFQICASIPAGYPADHHT